MLQPKAARLGSAWRCFRETGSGCGSLQQRVRAVRNNVDELHLLHCSPDQPELRADPVSRRRLDPPSPAQRTDGRYGAEQKQDGVGPSNTPGFHDFICGSGSVKQNQSELMSWLKTISHTSCLFSTWTEVQSSGVTSLLHQRHPEPELGPDPPEPVQILHRGANRTETELFKIAYQILIICLLLGEFRSNIFPVSLSISI